MNKKKLINDSKKKIISTKFGQKDWVKKLELLSGKPVTPRKGQMTTYLLIDCSGSMYGNKIIQARNGSLGYSMEAIEKGYSVGLILFSSNANLLLKSQNEISILKNKILEIEANGSTNLSGAIQIAIHNFKDSIGEKVICILTDGMPDSKSSSLKFAKQARDMGIDIMTIGTDDADQEFLKQLSSRSDLSIKVKSYLLEQGIISMAKLLPS